MGQSVKAIFLHHSTGNNILKGDANKYLYKLTKHGQVTQSLSKYNHNNKLKIEFSSQFFPKGNIYGWKNYPFDYYNIWVKNAGNMPYMGEPTLEILTAEFQVIIFKHCFPGSNILADTGVSGADSEVKSLEVYKEQYNKLKEKMHQFPNTKFIIWTLAALTEKSTVPENALRAKEFTEWVKNQWKEKGDNVYLFDFYSLETEGGLYLKNEFATSGTDSHPNKKFSRRVASEFCKCIINVVRD